MNCYLLINRLRFHVSTSFSLREGDEVEGDLIKMIKNFLL